MNPGSLRNIPFFQLSRGQEGSGAESPPSNIIGKIKTGLEQTWREEPVAASQSRLLDQDVLVEWSGPPSVLLTTLLEDLLRLEGTVHVVGPLRASGGFQPGLRALNEC